MSRSEKLSNLRRLKDVTVTKPFVYGTAAWWQGKNAEQEHSHRWTVFVRGLENEDLSYYIKKVTFQLHTSFRDSLRTVETPPFEVTETGWGEFSIGVKIYFHDTREPPVAITHQLRLFPENAASQSMKKPVMAECYDEFVFVSPTESFHQMLQAGPSVKFENSELTPFFTTKTFVEQERKHIAQLTTAHGKVVKRIEELRKRLYQANKEIVELSKPQ
jgi:YEATS domain-containing protein 4